MILTIDAMEDGEDSGHCGGSYKVSRNSCTALLPCDAFLHQPDVSFLLFDGAMLRAQGGFEDMVQLDLIRHAILHIEHVEMMYLRHHTRVVQQENGGIYLSSLRMVSDEKRVIRIIDGGVSEMPRSPCV